MNACPPGNTDTLSWYLSHSVILPVFHKRPKFRIGHVFNISNICLWQSVSWDQYKGAIVNRVTPIITITKKHPSLNPGYFQYFNNCKGGNSRLTSNMIRFVCFPVIPGSSSYILGIVC